MQERAAEQRRARYHLAHCKDAGPIIPILKGSKGAVGEVAKQGGVIPTGHPVRLRSRKSTQRDGASELRSTGLDDCVSLLSQGSISNRLNPRRCAIIGLINLARDSKRLVSSLRRSGPCFYSLPRRHKSARRNNLGLHKDDNGQAIGLDSVLCLHVLFFLTVLGVEGSTCTNGH
jgi:hypothetical protein